MCQSDKVGAQKRPGLAVSEWNVYFVPEYKSIGIATINLRNDAIVKVSSSNKKIATVKYDKVYDVVRVNIKEPGKVAINCTVKQSKKTYNTKCNFTILKYKNPFLNYKIGDQNYVSQFNKSTRYSRYINSIFKKNKTQKLQIKVKKGYTIMKLYYINKKGKSKEIKNGSKVKLDNISVIYVQVKDRKGNMGNDFGFFFL